MRGGGGSNDDCKFVIKPNFISQFSSVAFCRSCCLCIYLCHHPVLLLEIFITSVWSSRAGVKPYYQVPNNEFQNLWVNRG